MCRSLISSFGVMVRLRTETRFPPEGGYYEIVTGCDLIWQDGAEPEKAAEFLKGCLAGPTREQAEGWLAILQAACAPRRGSEATASVTLALYASTLMEYPADIAKTVCLHLARGNGPGTNWFPTLGEVVDAADKLARTRRVMVNESHFVRRGTPPAAIAQEAGPSESDRLEVKRMVEALKAELKPTPAKPYLFPQGKVDASGITSRLRALVEARRAP